MALPCLVKYNHTHCHNFQNTLHHFVISINLIKFHFMLFKCYPSLTTFSKQWQRDVKIFWNHTVSLGRNEIHPHSWSLFTKYIAPLCCSNNLINFKTKYKDFPKHSDFSRNISHKYGRQKLLSFSQSRVIS